MWRGRHSLPYETRKSKPDALVSLQRGDFSGPIPSASEVVLSHP